MEPLVIIVFIIVSPYFFILVLSSLTATLIISVLFNFEILTQVTDHKPHTKPALLCFSENQFLLLFVSILFVINLLLFHHYLVTN